MERLKKSSPAFFAILIFSIVELADLSGLVPAQQRGHFEEISNGAMIAVFVAGLFMVGLPFKANSNTQAGRDEKAFVILGNLAVSFIAFPMNISVFGHTLRREQLLADLWGWHLFWLICAAIQILLLSALGKRLLNGMEVLINAAQKLLNAIQVLLEEMREFGRWLKRLIKGNKAIYAIFLCWLIYLGIQIHIKGIAAVFFDPNIFWNSIWLWTAAMIILSLVRIMPLFLLKCKEALQEMSGRKVLAAVVAITFIALAGVFPIILKTIAILVLIPSVPAVFIWLAVKSGLQKYEGILVDSGGGLGTPLSAQQNITADGSSADEAVGSYMKYLSVLLVCFIVIPLAFIIFAMVIQGGWNQFPFGDPTNITAWLELLMTAAKVAKELLELF